MNVQRPNVDIPRLPPPGRQASVGAVADKPYESSRDEEGQDEGK
jgi:hypothetical protein